MVIRWVYVATLVVVTFTVTHCEESSPQNVNNSKAEDLCPCLPTDICPRVYGTKPDDAKYFGDIKKCDDDNHVRCCGASASFVVGKGSVTTSTTPRLVTILTTTQSPHPDISRLNPDDDLENEIPDSENDSVTVEDEPTESGSSSESDNINNFHQTKFMNEEIDEEPAESVSITETAHKHPVQEQSIHEFDMPDIQGSTETDQYTTEAVTTEVLQPKSHRKPKNLDNVMMVYPNFMSGIPKTTPKNMPETNEMKMFDEEVGMDLHLVFSRTTLKPEIITQNIEETDKDPINSTTKQPHFRFAKRRRQYGPVQRRTTEAPVEGMELAPTTISSRTMTRPTKAKIFSKRPSPQESAASITKSPRVKKPTRTPMLQEEEEEEILHTSEDDKTQTNRFRLFSARHRLNYLQRTTTTTTETPLEVSTSHNSQSKPLENRRPSKLNESSHPKASLNVRPAKMNETLIHRMDTDHRNMISKVRVALKAAATENQIVEIPRSFASADMNSRVKKIEKMLVNNMMKAYTEMQMKRRGDRPKTTSEPTNIVQNNKKISTTERTISKPVSNNTRPYRGKKKFELSDLLDKSLTVAMPNEVRRMRIRSTTVKPTEVVTEATRQIPTTRVQRRRPTTTIQPSQQNFNEKKTSSEGTTFPVNKSYRRRAFIRRKFAVEPTLTTTMVPLVNIKAEPTLANIETARKAQPTLVNIEAEPTLVRTTSETITTVEYTTIIPSTTTASTTTASTTTASTTTTTPTPITSESSEVVEEPDTSTEHVEIVTTPQQNIDSAVSSEFKASPLWSIKSNEPTDFVEVDGDEVANEKIRRSRNIFEPPSQYINGFIPVVPVNLNP